MTKRFLNYGMTYVKGAGTMNCPFREFCDHLKTDSLRCSCERSVRIGCRQQPAVSAVWFPLSWTWRQLVDISPRSSQRCCFHSRDDSSITLISFFSISSVQPVPTCCVSDLLGSLMNVSKGTFESDEPNCWCVHIYWWICVLMRCVWFCSRWKVINVFDTCQNYCLMLSACVFI